MTTTEQEREELESLGGEWNSAYGHWEFRLSDSRPITTLEADEALELLRRIEARDVQREAEMYTKAEVIKLLDGEDTSCSECSRLIEPTRENICENCDAIFHEACAAYAYHGEGEYPSESAYALCGKCAPKPDPCTCPKPLRVPPESYISPHRSNCPVYKAQFLSPNPGEK